MMYNIKIKIKTLSLIVLLLACMPTLSVQAAEPSVGAINYFYDMTGAKSVSVDMQPNWGESGYHYYSISSLFTETDYGMYAGIQTNGNLGDGKDIGNVFLFSIWNATQAFPAEGATATPFGGEGIGYSIRKSYDWSVGVKYRVTMQRGIYDSKDNGYRWSASVKNLSSGAVLNLGDILAPNGANTLRGNAVFHERYHGHTPTCSESSSNLEKAGVTFSNLSSDTSISFSGLPAPNNLFASSACSPHIHESHTASSLKTGFGVSSSEFALGGTTSSRESAAPSRPGPTPGITTPSVKDDTSEPGDPKSNDSTIDKEEKNDSTVDKEEKLDEFTNNATPFNESNLDTQILPWSADTHNNQSSLVVWLGTGVAVSLIIFSIFLKFNHLNFPSSLKRNKL